MTDISQIHLLAYPIIRAFLLASLPHSSRMPELVNKQKSDKYIDET